MINLEDTEIMNHLNIGIALYRTFVVQASLRPEYGDPGLFDT